LIRGDLVCAAQKAHLSQTQQKTNASVVECRQGRKENEKEADEGEEEESK
jgi:hypothetical protein